MQKILLVEDNPMNRDLISRRLQRRGFEIVLAEDGAEGVEKASSAAPDLILMDMGLPVIDGYAATRILKEDPNTRAIPIIGLSAHAMSGDADRALAAGCDDYDTKPVEWPRLLTKIQAQLERAAEMRSRAPAEEPSAGEADAGAEESDRQGVLVVDENGLHREILAGRLRALGYRSEALEDGHKALQRLQEVSFDAVLVSVSLAHVDGRSLVEHLSARWPDLPVLMVSTADTVGQAVEHFQKGALDYIAQPFRQEELGARLQASLDRQTLRREAEAWGRERDEERRRNEHLLSVLLPRPLISELRSRGRLAPKPVEEATILVASLTGFTRQLEEQDSAEALVDLQRFLVLFEEIAEAHGIEKIRSSGSTLFAAAGLFSGSSSALHAVRCAVEFRRACIDSGLGEAVRFGLHLGPVTVGIVGHRRYQFDVWGSTVELAGRVKSSVASNEVHVSEAVWQAAPDEIEGAPVGSLSREGNPPLGVYRVDRIRS